MRVRHSREQHSASIWDTVVKARTAALAYCVGLVALPALAQQPKPEPLWQAFAAVYDANAPLTLKGTLVRADWLEPRSVVWLKTGAGGETKLWRIETGAASLFDVPDRARLAPGIEVSVRGYNAKNQTCAETCRMAGRAFTLKGGGTIAPRIGQGVCAVEDLIRETCTAANRPGPPPQIN
jgi:hypothetical protein